MNITEYRSANLNTKVPSDIVERWETRVVAQRLDRIGSAGAESYIAQFCKGAKAPKLIAFAVLAEIKGAKEFADRMWQEAYSIDPRSSEKSSGDPSPNTEPKVPKQRIRAAFAFLPQLLTVIEIGRAIMLLLTGRYCLQEKHNGERMVAEITDGKVQAGNKKGLASVRSLPQPILAELADYADCVIDSEYLPKQLRLVIFDLLCIEGRDIRHLPYEIRLQMLEELTKKSASKKLHKHVNFIESFTFSTRAAIEAMINKLDKALAEGFVVKNLDAPYTEGDGHTDQWKVQFRATNSFIVGTRTSDKDSLEIFAYDKDGNLVSVGNVTVSASEIDSIPKGSIAEVQYIYAHRKTNNLSQAVWQGVRSDASPEDCQLTKLRYEQIVSVVS